MDEIKIIHEPTSDSPFLVINKPKGLASAPLNSNDKSNALSIAAEKYPEILTVKGKKEIEGGLIHRIDTVTDGLLLFATTQEAFDKVQLLQSENKFIKYYSATCTLNKENKNLLGGFPEFNNNFEIKTGNSITVESFFRGYGKGQKEVRPVTKDSNPAALKKIGKQKLYSTEIKILKIENDRVFVECKISQGYRHQVRCHLAWIGLPIEGDSLYNSEDLNGQKKIAFTATKLELPGTRFELA